MAADDIIWQQEDILLAAGRHILAAYRASRNNIGSRQTQYWLQTDIILAARRHNTDSRTNTIKSIKKYTSRQ